MRDSSLTPARSYAKGMGEAVADRTINRKIKKLYGRPSFVAAEFPRRDDISLDKQVEEYCKSAGLIHNHYFVAHGNGEKVQVSLSVIGEMQTEKWADVADRVSMGNALLHPDDIPGAAKEFHDMRHHLRQASLLLSGRHLQHGDQTQPHRNMEVFTNCATAAVSFLSFYLLLNGSGVGRSYDDDMMAVDWRYMPITVPVIDGSHPDVLSGEVQALDARNARHLYAGRKVETFTVPDSREGWAKAVEVMEVMAFERDHRETVLLLDFSGVRHHGAPIKGMQDRPASGPGPLMNAIKSVAQLRDSGMEPWRQAMYADHYLAECVLVGGARRAARMATKTWRDPSVIDFVNVKRPLEFHGRDGGEIKELRETGHFGSFLWSSNNSVMVDEEFWASVRGEVQNELSEHAKAVFEAVVTASYFDGTGEPGLINQDKLTQNSDGIQALLDGDFAESKRYKLMHFSKRLTAHLANVVSTKPLYMITNPCGEICLNMLGAYCVIADVVPLHAGSLTRNSGFVSDTDPEFRDIESWDADAQEAFEVATRALIRVNTMDSLYGKEVERTNRIGVGFTGFHEWAFARFGFGWHDIIDEEKSKEMWLTMSRFKRAVVRAAGDYSHLLGVVTPHTNTTAKPAGTTSKLFGLTEGAHLPSMREFLRWVQFRNDDPLVEVYRAKGYPVRKLQVYQGTTIVGFPTQPTICSLGMGSKLVTAAEATPEEQYRYLALLEKYWIRGVEEDGVTPLVESGNQLSYTMKYNPELVTFEEFKRTLLEGQSKIRCCSVMPQTDTASYEYQPEEPVTKAKYELIAAAVAAAEDGSEATKEDVDFAHVDCGTGGCPVDFDK